MKKGKAPGHDDLPTELILEGGEASVKIYHVLCTKVWESGSWPTSWIRSIYVPFPKKGDLKLCTNYRTIALISHASKILLKIILKRLQAKMKEEINITQAGFQQGRGTRDHIFNMRNIIEKCREYNIDLYTCFIDYSKAFDCVQHEVLWKIMIEMGFPVHIIKLIKSLYDEQQASVRINGETSEWFKVGQGVRQGCIISPHLFNIYTENIMRQLHSDPNPSKYSSLSIGGHELPELRYADDTVLLSTTPTGLEELINDVKEHSEKQNLYLNAKKTKIMKTDKSKQCPEIKVNNDTLEVVNEFQYLGTKLTHNGNINNEIKGRCAMAFQKLKKMKKLWQGTSKSTRVKLLRTCIFPIATYGSEAWTMNRNAEKAIASFEMKCYRNILKIAWMEKRTNESILNELSIEKSWLLNTVKKKRLAYFGHIKRHQSLEKTILEGKMPGHRNRGRPKRRWSDDIEKDLETDLSTAGRMAMNRDLFRSTIMKAMFRKEHAT